MTRARLVRTLLVGSLALNLFLAGAFAAHWAGRLLGPEGFGPPGPPPVGRPFAPPPPAVLRSLLPESERPLLDATVAAHDAGITASFAGLAAARDRVRQALAAEPFDANTLAAAFADLRSQEDLVAAAVQAMLTDLLGRLDPAARRRVVEAWQEGPPGAPPPRFFPGDAPGGRPPPP